MEDLERYADYNDSDDYAPKSRSVVGIVLKAIIGIVILAVVCVLGYRMFLFNRYPDSMKNIYFDEKLLAYYNETDGNIGALTQKLRAPYDDADVANFFCDNLIIIKGVDQIQLSVRYNVSAIQNMEAKYGLSGLDADDPALLSFRLYDNYGRVYSSLVHFETDSMQMYRYCKLVFDGVELDEPEDGLGYPEWIRLEIFVAAAESDEPFAMVPIYENNESYRSFEEYSLSREEIPE